MLELVLYEPEIPPNTGNLIRLVANTGSTLHLVRPLGFRLNDRTLRRAELDYGSLAQVIVHEDWKTCRAHFNGRKIFAFSTRAQHCYADAVFGPQDVLLFGPESRGLPQSVLAEFPSEQRLRVPMLAGTRSINLANAAAVVMYEAWRQLGFPGAQR